jgi:hypothetical protein
MRVLPPAVACFCLVVPAVRADGGPAGVVSTSVCGADRCVAADGASLIAEVGFRKPPALPAPYFLVVTSIASADSIRTTYDYDVPSKHRIRLDDVWWTWPNDNPGTLLSLTARMLPLQPPTPTLATVGGRSVTDPSSYLPLFFAARLGSACGGPWLRVTIRAGRPSPWTDGRMDIRLARRSPCLWLDGWSYRLPRSVVRLARRGLPLGP